VLQEPCLARPAGLRVVGRSNLAVSAGDTIMGTRKQRRAPAPEPQPDQAEPSKPLSKKQQVLQLLRAPSGASAAELEQATGWLPHTVRAALTGIRKSGVVITKEKVEGTTRYSLASA
jgi:hypothetical protein